VDVILNTGISSGNHDIHDVAQRLKLGYSPKTAILMGKTMINQRFRGYPISSQDHMAMEPFLAATHRVATTPTKVCFNQMHGVVS
jgi:hypothetical protein